MDHGRTDNQKPVREYYFDERCYVSEWWNRREDDPVSVARVRVEQGVTTKLHRLRNITERYLVLAGHGQTEIGGNMQQVGPGDVVVVPAGIPQRITNIGKRDLAFLAICTPRFVVEAYEDLEPHNDEDGNATQAGKSAPG